MPRKTHAALALMAVVLIAAGTVPVTVGGATPGAAGVPHYDQTLEWSLAFQASSLWAYTEGAGIRVAVVDTGVDVRRSDLVGKVDDLTPGPPGNESIDSHGTTVGGLIAGRGSPADAERIAGLAPAAILIYVRIGRQAADVSTVGIASGIIAALRAGAQIINVSLGVPRDDRAIDFADNHSGLVVASTGAGSAPQYPAASPEVLAVAPTGKNLVPMTSLDPYQPWAVYAPGQGLYSSGKAGYLTDLSGNDHATATATATATAPAAAGLVSSRAPRLGASSARRLLVRTVSGNAAGPGPRILDPLAVVQESQAGGATPGPTAGSGPTQAQQRPTAKASSPAAASGSGLRPVVIVLAAVLAILVIGFVIAWLIKSGPGTPRGRPGHVPGSLDVHF